METDQQTLTKPAPELTPEQEQKQRYERWRQKMAVVAEKVRDARKSLVEEVARRKEFQYLDETIGHNPERYPDILDIAAGDYVEGRFFLEQISLFCVVSPLLSLTIYELRQEWIREYELRTVPELLLLDQAMLAYFHVIRLNKEVANMLSLTEQTLFYPDEPHMRARELGRKMGWKMDHFVAEDHVRKLQDMLLPMVERFNLMFLRNLKAMRELKAHPVSINIGQAGQVNVGQQQVNVAGGQ